MASETDSNRLPGGRETRVSIRLAGVSSSSGSGDCGARVSTLRSTTVAALNPSLSRSARSCLRSAALETSTVKVTPGLTSTVAAVIL